jgi:hypothetical protein
MDVRSKAGMRVLRPATLAGPQQLTPVMVEALHDAAFLVGKHWHYRMLRRDRCCGAEDGYRVHGIW